MESTDIYVTHTIAIPRVIVLPQGVVRAGFKEFTLDLSSFRLQPVSKEILVQHLASDITDVIGALEGGQEEERLEDYVVRGLIDFDDVSYDEQADLLYNLAGQLVAHIQGYLKDDAEVRNVLLFHQRQQLLDVDRLCLLLDLAGVARLQRFRFAEQRLEHLLQLLHVQRAAPGVVLFRHLAKGVGSCERHRRAGCLASERTGQSTCNLLQQSAEQLAAELLDVLPAESDTECGQQIPDVTPGQP